MLWWVCADLGARYLMRYENLSLKDAMTSVRAVRELVDPNIGALRGLLGIRAPEARAESPRSDKTGSPRKCEWSR